MRSYLLALFALFGMMAISANSIVPPPITPAQFHFPLCRVDFTTPQLHALMATVSYDVGTDFDTTNGHSWKMTGYGSSYLSIAFTAQTLSRRSYSLSLTAASGQAFPNFAKISISVNGQMTATGFELIHSDFLVYHFDITAYMQQGDNEIQISLDPDTQSGFCIQSLAVK